MIYGFEEEEKLSSVTSLNSILFLVLVLFNFRNTGYKDWFKRQKMSYLGTFPSKLLQKLIINFVHVHSKLGQLKFA